MSASDQVFNLDLPVFEGSTVSGITMMMLIRSDGLLHW
jgi:hypothetical protein